MTVGLLLITHDALGGDLLKTATRMLGRVPLPTEAMRVTTDEDPETILDQARAVVARLDQGDGVLVLTDAYGSTPSNVANRLAERDRVAVVAGINLPMLIRIFNYAQLDLAQLTEKALTGGREGVVVYHDR